MKVITGGAGFIGSAICWRLNTLGINDIIIVDESRYGEKANNLANLQFSEYMDKMDFLKLIRNDTFPKRVDTLYHMGACSSTTENDMEYLMENNVEYSRSCAIWCIKNNIRYVYASSAATYGDGSEGFDDNIELIPKLKPLNKYGLSKQIFDMWVIEHNYQSKFAGLKYFNVYGPNENHKGDMRSMVNKTFGQIMETGKLKLFKSLKPEFKDGEQKRDFIYVKDAVEMTLFFDAENEKGSTQSGIFNIGSGEASTWLQLAGAIFKALGKEPVIEFIDMPENLRNQYQYYSKANLTKLLNAGYENGIMTLDNAVKDYVLNYLKPGLHLQA